MDGRKFMRRLWAVIAVITILSMVGMTIAGYN